MNVIKKILPVLSPVLFSLSYILTLYNHNIGNLTLQILPVPLAVYGSGTVILTVLLYIFIKNVPKTSIIASAVSVLYFSFGDLTGIIINAGKHSVWLQNAIDSICGIISVSVIFILYRIISKPGRNLARLGRYTGLCACIVFFIPVTSISYYELSVRNRTDIKSVFRIPAVPEHSIPAEMPDIYYIVPDSFTAPSVSERYFGFDNSAFSVDLEKRGFYVADKATSNYPKTYLSLASTLNMEYLDYMSVYHDSSDETRINPLIKTNTVLLFLKSLGYRYYQLGSWWGPTQQNPLADINYNLDLQNPLGINTFDTLIMETSALKPFLPMKLFSSIVTESVEDKRRRTIYQTDMLPEIAKLPGPKFVFAHILNPHGPNVFGKNCEYISQESLWTKTDEQGYADQVRCMDKKLLTAIDNILSVSQSPPVILLHSDEGAPFLAHRVSPDDNWKTADSQLLRKKFPVLAAYFLPGENKTEGLYESITPVNAFRVILNAYFPVTIPLLPDRNFVNLDMNHRYEFLEVTDLVK